MEDVDDLDGPFEALTALVAVATLPAGILTAMFAGGGASAVVFVVGWLFFVPVLGILSRVVDIGTETDVCGSDRHTGPIGQTDDEALGQLRERYAGGEIDETEFERRVERLLEHESE